jgi:hypothetical protein
MSIARNDPCPCGSGKKFKQCCGVTGAPPLPALDESGEPIPRAWKLPVGLVLLAIGLGVGIGVLRDSVSDGLAVGGAALLMVVGYLVIRTPPGSTGRGGGTNIDYGMNKPKRRKRAKSRSERRRDG